MKLNNKTKNIILSAFVATLCTTSANATIVIANPSFDVDDLGDALYQNGNIDSWNGGGFLQHPANVETTASRTLFGNPTWLASNADNQVPSGVLAGGISSTQSLSQPLFDDLGGIVAYDPTKSISLDLFIGRRGDQSSNSDATIFNIELIGESGTIYYNLQYDTSAINIDNGGMFIQNSVILNPTQISGPASDIGGQITLRFIGGGSGGQAFFDDLSNPALVDAPAPVIPVLNINRNTGNIQLANATDEGDFNFIHYAIDSANGSINTANWNSITGNTDASGDGTSDGDDNWIKFSGDDQNNQIAEGTLGTSTLSMGQSIDLGNTWVQSPFQDISINFQLDDGTYQQVAVNYFGDEIKLGDFDFDGDIDAADWAIVKDNNGADLSAMVGIESYAFGDINSDNTNDILDFGIFKDAYEAENGAGSFALIAVPEPTSIALISLAGLAMLRRKNS